MKQNKHTSLPKEIHKDIKDGTKLAGDDYSDEMLKRWYQEEEEAYYLEEVSNQSSDKDPWYVYMRYVNDKIGFKNINQINPKPSNLLSIGPGAGNELERWSKENNSCEITFLESSSNFRKILSRKFEECKFIETNFKGNIDAPDNSFDSILCFSVLHHIPNITHVFSEIERVTKPGGVILIREPASSMGDWRYERSATPNERGISKKFLLNLAKSHDLSVFENPRPILFEPINKILLKKLRLGFLPMPLIYFLDTLISNLLSFNDFYWRDSFLKKFGPGSYFITFVKPN